MSVMLLIRGALQVIGDPISSAVNASISGVAGIGHIMTGVGIILLLMTLKKLPGKGTK